MTPHGTSAPHLDDEPDAVMWQLRSATPEDCARLAEELRIHPATARVLAARGWNTPALAARFLNPDREDILDPSHLPDFDRAIVRTLQAIRNRGMAAGKWTWHAAHGLITESKEESSPLFRRFDSAIPDPRFGDYCRA